MQTHSDVTRDLIDPRASAEAAGLRYVPDQARGITRHRRGRGFSYRGPDGRRLTDRRTLDRIRALVIPPAWTDVWIAPWARAHLQAVGRDARGRKQYRYHPLWRAVRDEIKHERMLAFADVLPSVRRRVTADLRRLPSSRDHVLARVVQLLERTLIRVGNDEYARLNRSYGLTTLHGRHASVRGTMVRFRFRAKSGVVQTVTIDDGDLARFIRLSKRVPGRMLFQCVDDAGRPTPIDSADVNAYLRDAAGADFSAKDFRTWAGTVLAAVHLASLPVESGASATARRRSVVRAVDAVAARLGNTRAVCRTGYIHPAMIDAYLGGETIDPDIPPPEPSGPALSPAAEAAVLALLRRRGAAAVRRAA